MTQPPRNAIALLKEKNVVVDRILHHLLNKDNPGRDGDDNSSPPALEEEAVVEYDSGCAQCGQVHILGNSTLRNRGVLNALADNLLWEKGQTLVYYTTKEGWPSEEIYELVASAAEVAVWAWNEIDLGITLTHKRSKPTEFTHMIRYGDKREGNIAANGNFPTKWNPPRITFYEKAFSKVPGGRERLLSRMIHEFGHTLGFYHEFEADPNDGRGVAIGRRDVKSIMGYHRDRTITKSDIESFPLIYEIEEGTLINKNLGAMVRYIRTKPFNEPDRSGDASDGREDGILDIFSPILRMFDINKQTLNKAIEASKHSELIVPKSKKNEQEIFERNAGIISTGLGLGINLLSTLFRSSDENRDGGILDSVVNIGKSLIVDAAKGAAEGALGGLLRSGDGTGIVINKTVTPANMGVFAIKNLTETVGMRSITLLVDENDGPSSQMSKNQKIMASGEWLLSKYSQLLLWEMIDIIIADKKSSSPNSMDSKDLIKTIAHKSIDILENIPLLAASINVKDGTTMQGNDKHSLIESVIKHCREDNDQLPLVLKNLMLSVLLPHEDEESEHSLFGHIADYHNDHKLSPRIIFYSITPDDVDASWSLMICDVEFSKYDLIYDRILEDHNNLDEVNAFCIAKNSTSRHTLLQGLSPKGDRGNDNNQNDDGHNSTNHGEITSDTVRIHLAMVNPKGGHPEKDEWITLCNYSPDTQVLKNWKLRDQNNREFDLGGTKIMSGHSVKIYPRASSQMVLTNKGGTLELIDMDEKVVHKVEWSNQNTNENKVLEFDN